jgi:hypothetical protein
MSVSPPLELESVPRAAPAVSSRPPDPVPAVEPGVVQFDGRLAEWLRTTVDGLITGAPILPAVRPVPRREPYSFD